MVSSTALLVAGIIAFALVPVVVALALLHYMQANDFFVLFGAMVVAVVLTFVGFQAILAWRKRRPGLEAPSSPQSP
jgi:hypothetical protein